MATKIVSRHKGKQMGLKDELLSGGKIAVWGCGFIGLSTLVHYAREGVRGIGYDVDSLKIAEIYRGVCPIQGLEEWMGVRIKTLMDKGLFTATPFLDDMRNKNIKVHFVAVPTERDGEPWLDAFWEVMGRIRDIYREGQVIIVESTLLPYTSSEVKHFFEVKRGKSPIYCVAPRRDWFTSRDKTIKNIPRVFGVEKEYKNDVEGILGIITDQLVWVESPVMAELVKCVENAYRHMDITLANQLTMAFPDMDMKKILEVASTKWNVNLFQPSFGCGGYCIPLSSKYLMYACKKDVLTLLDETIKTDNLMPSVVSHKVEKYKKIGILGLAYKGGLKVHILSPTFGLLDNLKNSEVWVHDPLYTPKEITQITGKKYLSFPNDLDKFDCILVVTDHCEYRQINHEVLRKKLRKCKLVMDNTGIWKDIKLGCPYSYPGKAKWLGWSYGKREKENDKM